MSKISDLQQQQAEKLAYLIQSGAGPEAIRERQKANAEALRELAKQEQEKDRGRERERTRTR